MASGWNLWVWLQCIGVASRCCYKEVYSVYPPIIAMVRSIHSVASDSYAPLTGFLL